MCVKHQCNLSKQTHYLLSDFITSENKPIRNVPDQYFLHNREGVTFEELIGDSQTNNTFQNLVADICQSRVTCSQEVTSSPYRTLDGSCNNLVYPQWGMANRPQRRTLPHAYEDGKAESS